MKKTQIFIFYDYIQYINILENILHIRSDPKKLKISQAGLVFRSTAGSEHITPAENTHAAHIKSSHVCLCEWEKCH